VCAVQIVILDTGILVMLPYGSDGPGTTGACIVLPDVAGPEGMQATVDELLGSDLAFDGAVDLLQGELVQLRLPRFRIEYGVTSLKETLVAMGVTEAFRPGAQLGRISDKDAFLGDFVVKALVDVNEEGTTAAAVAVASGTRGGGPPPKPRPMCVFVNRPFLFVVCDMNAAPRPNLVHFIAKIETP